MSQRVWTTGRKVWGNVVPLLFAIPFVAFGLWRVQSIGNPLHWSVLLWFAASVVVAWLAIGIFGLLGNAKMRSILIRRFASEADSASLKKRFVGMATPTYRSLWDPHEDIGFLSWNSTSLFFQGDSKRIEIPKSAIRRIRPAANIHSWLGLGGWVLIEGLLDGKAIQLMIEPRDRPTLWGNRKILRPLAAELESWLASSS